jgi:hypothetical protein
MKNQAQRLQTCNEKRLDNLKIMCYIIYVIKF